MSEERYPECGEHDHEWTDNSIGQPHCRKCMRCPQSHLTTLRSLQAEHARSVMLEAAAETLGARLTMLAEEICRAAVAGCIVDPDVSLSGPEVLMIAQNVTERIVGLTAERDALRDRRPLVAESRGQR